MGSECLIIFSLLCTLLVVAEGLEVKLNYCTLKCSDKCKSNSGGTPKPRGYYWRDYTGIVPSDAYPIVEDDRYPRHYIGRVLDQASNGTFFVTIIEGQDFVHRAFQGETKKINDFIQILCTMQPKKFSWLKLSRDNFREATKEKDVVVGSHHYVMTTTRTAASHFIVKPKKCDLASNGLSLTGKVEFALENGQYASTEDFEFLLFDKNYLEEKEEGKEESKNKLVQSTIKIKPGPIIPIFYFGVTIGPCSIACTNQPKTKKSTKGDSIKPQNVMDYYWKPKQLYLKNKEDAFFVSTNAKNKSLYIGLTYASVNWLDVGPTTNSVEISLGEDGNLADSFYYSVLSTDQPEKFVWVKTNSKEFPKLDKSRMIRGGRLDNGTLTYAGRHQGIFSLTPASVRLLKDETIATSWLETSVDFEILMTKGQND